MHLYLHLYLRKYKVVFKHFCTSSHPKILKYFSLFWRLNLRKRNKCVSSQRPTLRLISIRSKFYVTNKDAVGDDDGSIDDDNDGGDDDDNDENAKDDGNDFFKIIQKHWTF